MIEFPAGLVGDEPGREQEDLIEAARRELLEETGYRAGKLNLVSTSATSPGLTNELVRFVLASELRKVGKGGGTPSENIRVHEVALREARAWLTERERQGTLLAAKFFAGLFFAHEAWLVGLASSSSPAARRQQGRGRLSRRSMSGMEGSRHRSASQAPASRATRLSPTPTQAAAALRRSGAGPGRPGHSMPTTDRGR